MKKFSSKLVLLITAFMIFMTPALTKVAAEEVQPEALNEIVILHTNDMHGQITNKYELAYLKAYRESLGAQFLLDAGDASQGLPVANVTRGRTMGELMTAVGFDAMTIGNHEFDYSRETALGEDEGFFTASTAIDKLVTNVVYTEEAGAGKPAGTRPAAYKGSIVQDVVTTSGETIKVSLFGLATPETPFKADPRNSKGIAFLDPIPALKKELALPEHADSDLYIVLGHLGTDLETKVEWRAQTLGETLSEDETLNDKNYVIIDGHSHTDNPSGRTFGTNVIYGQTGGALGQVGEMHINLDNFADSTAQTVTMLTAKDPKEHPETPISERVSPDPTIIQQIDTVLAEFDESTKEVLLTGNPVLLDGVRGNVRTRETNLGNLITDSMYEYGLDTFQSPTHVAVLNGGGIRTSIQPGDISLKDVITVQPFGNRLVQIDVSGENIVAMFEHSLGTETTEEVDENGLPRLGEMGGYLHVSDSIRVKFDPRNPAGSRVQDIQIIDHDLNELVPLEADKIYKVVTLEFLAVGGDGYTMLGGPRSAGTTDAEVLSDFFRAHQDGTKPIDWDAYSPELPIYRVVPTKYIAEDTDEVLQGKVDEANTILAKADEYTETSVTNLRTALDTAEDVLNRLAPTRAALNAVSEEEYNQVLANLTGAINNMEKKDVKPTEPEDPKPPVVEPEKPTDKTDPKTPGTGVETNLPLVSSVIALLAGGGYLALRKRKD